MNTPLPLEAIILPKAIGTWPLAWGWWLLLGLSAFAIAVISWQLYKYLGYRHRYRAAQQLLTQLCQNKPAAEAYAAVNTWLKLQAQQAYPAALSLHGQAWLDFLQHSAQKPLFSPEMAQALSQGLYQAEPLNLDLQRLQRAALAWLKASKALRGGRPCSI